MRFTTLARSTRTTLLSSTSVRTARDGCPRHDQPEGVRLAHGEARAAVPDGGLPRGEPRGGSRVEALQGRRHQRAVPVRGVDAAPARVRRGRRHRGRRAPQGRRRPELVPRRPHARGALAAAHRRAVRTRRRRASPHRRGRARERADRRFTPAHLAAASGRAVEALLAGGADVAAKSNNGATPFAAKAAAARRRGRAREGDDRTNRGQQGARARARGWQSSAARSFCRTLC